tara:strand:- start:54 stop:455 length:402 start_codon:yes stop_codon:yes gene_type:complete
MKAMKDSIEYKFLGMSMEKVGSIYGFFLILWALIISYLSSSNSITSLIPAFFGIPMLLFSLIAILLPDKKKFFMHLVVTISLLTLIGGLDFLRSLSNPFQNIWADLSKLMMLLTGAFYTFQCIKSFKHAKKNN